MDTEYLERNIEGLKQQVGQLEKSLQNAQAMVKEHFEPLQASITALRGRVDAAAKDLAALKRG